MQFRTRTPLRNLIGTAQGLWSSGSFRGSEGSEVSNKWREREAGVERRYPPLESLAGSPEPRPLGTLPLEACLCLGLGGSTGAPMVPEPTRLGVCSSQRARSRAGRQELTASRLSPPEKGRPTGRQTPSFNVEVSQCL